MAKTIIGIVSSDKADKTIVVTVHDAQDPPAVPQAVHGQQEVHGPRRKERSPSWRQSCYRRNPSNQRPQALYA